MWASIRAQFKSIFSSKKTAIPVVAVFLIPVLYSGTFLFAFWDPYGKTENLPVAVVNEDHGTVFHGKHLDVGNDLVKKLKKSPTFDWKFVSEKQAKDGFDRNKYYMIIRIPDTFSEKAATVMTDHPEKVDIIYIPNGNYNFLASKIGSSAIEKMKENLGDELTKNYSTVMFENISDLSAGLKKASDGAGNLDSGLKKASDGTSRLLQGMQAQTPEIAALNHGAAALSQGAGDLTGGLDKLLNAHEKILEGQRKVTEGTQNLQSGLQKASEGSQAIEDNSQKLSAGSVQLAQGAKTFSQSADKWKAGADQVSQGSEALEAGLGNLAAHSSEMSPEELKMQLQKLYAVSQSVHSGMGDLANGAQGLSAGASQIASNSQKISDGQSALAKGAGTLNSGQQQLALGAIKLSGAQNQLSAGSETFQEKLAEAKAGAGKVADGSTQLTKGTNGLKEGWQQVTGHVQTLKDGQLKLYEGSHELAGKLGDAAKKTGEIHGGDKTTSMFSSPVEVKTDNQANVSNYGTGIAPYFLSLGLYVGALLLTIVFPLRNAEQLPSSPYSWFIGKYSFLAFSGVIQAVIADSIVLYGLGMHVQSVPKFYLFSIITSLAFMAIVQFFVTTMENPGRYVAVLLLILQLTTSAGTFPLEMLPKGLQRFHNYLPMSYSVEGFKAVISAGDYSVLWHDAMILIGFALVFMAFTQLFFVRFFKKIKRQTVEA